MSHTRKNSPVRLAVWTALLWLLPVWPATVATVDLTFDQRVDSQREIEKVRWSHRVLPEATLRAKVASYLAMSRVLEERWDRPVTAELLQEEIERIVRHTQDPQRLRELFAALQNDPLRIAECLARPVLVERTIRRLYAHDRAIHGPLKLRLSQALGAAPSAEILPRLGGQYVELTLTPEPVEPALAEPAKFDPNRSVVGPEAWRRLQRLAPGEFSQLTERVDGFEIEVLLEKSPGEILLARVRWPKQPFDAWWRVVTQEMNVAASLLLALAAPGPFEYTVPATPAGTCTDDTWSATSIGTDVPGPREFHSAIWTGNEMIVWGGRDPLPLNSGGRYDPATDSWTPTASTGAPSPRFHHTALWTGTEMIVWGGWGGAYESSGARYDPATDSWTPTGTDMNLPDGRTRHTAVWTGDEMIVWGGYNDDDGDLSTGGLYDPAQATEGWAATATTGDVPDGRTKHTAVWTGSAMIVWGGGDDVEEFETGGVYDPAADTWSETSTGADLPTARVDHTAVWTGDEMIVWGGAGFRVYATGGRYAPATNEWSPTSTTGDAASARRLHSVAWSEGEMIVWGGIGGGSSGGRYWPVADSWTATSIAGAPAARRHHTAVWTGLAHSRMIVWGGFTSSYSNTGGVYCAVCPETTWYRDLDEDGFGDPNVTQLSCARPPGYVFDGSDCDDTNPNVWAIPGPTRDLRFIDRQSLSWLPPMLPAGTSPVYDTIRADTPTTFESAGLCIETNNPSTDTTDPDDPDPAAYYLIRAGNGCGEGPVGVDSAGVPRSAVACP